MKRTRVIVEKQKTPTLDPAKVRKLSEQVYAERLGPDDTKRLLAQEGGQGKLTSRAAAYDPLTRAYLRALNITKL